MPQISPVQEWVQELPEDSPTWHSGTDIAALPVLQQHLASPGSRHAALSTDRIEITGGSYTLSWTVPSGSINHYTLQKVASGGAVSNTTYPGNATAVALTGSAPPGTSKVLTYTLRACSTADESSCGAWSNPVEISIDLPCTTRCQ